MSFLEKINALFINPRDNYRKIKPYLSRNLFKAIRRLLEPLGIEVFSKPFPGHKELIEFINLKKGFFVEVGANDGFFQDPTYFYERILKWRGILIEPLPYLFKACIENRPGAKVYNYACVPANFKKKEGIYACTGIMYNHESPRRGYQYITRKVAHSVAQIKMGYLDKLTIGNLEAQRDWGYAPDFVLGMWKMLQGKVPDDYILATSKLRSVRDLIETAFSIVGMDYGQYIKVDQKYFRPSEKIPLCGDPSKIQKDLKWENKKDFKEMISEMIEHESKILYNENIKN